MWKNSLASDDITQFLNVQVEASILLAQQGVSFVCYKPEIQRKLEKHNACRNAYANNAKSSPLSHECENAISPPFARSYYLRTMSAMTGRTFRAPTAPPALVKICNDPKNSNVSCSFLRLETSSLETSKWVTPCSAYSAICFLSIPNRHAGYSSSFGAILQ